MNKILLAAACLFALKSTPNLNASAASPSGVDANGPQLLQMPESRVLEERLRKKGFDEFVERTRIHEKLGGQIKDVRGVAAQLEVSCYEYIEYWKDPYITMTIGVQKKELLEILLKDFPGELARYNDSFKKPASGFCAIV